MESENIYIEVVVQQKRSKYHATCPLFPQCKGIGSNEQDALKKLSKTIGKHVSKITTELLSNIFSSNEYSELILDPKQKKGVIHRAFNLEAQSLPFYKKIILKLSSFEKKGEKTVSSPMESQPFFDILQKKENQQNLPFPSEESSKNDFLFGVPISLN